MILDKSLLLSDAQAVTTTAASTNVIDTGAEGQAIEPGSWVYVNISTAFTIAGATKTVQAQLQTGTSATMADGVTLATSAAVSTVTAGSPIMKLKVPLGLKRYVRLYYTMGGTASAGNIDAFICNNVPFLITDDDND